MAQVLTQLDESTRPQVEEALRDATRETCAAMRRKIEAGQDIPQAERESIREVWAKFDLGAPDEARFGRSGAGPH